MILQAFILKNLKYDGEKFKLIFKNILNFIPLKTPNIPVIGGLQYSIGWVFFIGIIFINSFSFYILQ
jgi:hypothetical protein